MYVCVCVCLYFSLCSIKTAFQESLTNMTFTLGASWSSQLFSLHISLFFFTSHSLNTHSELLLCDTPITSTSNTQKKLTVVQVVGDTDVNQQMHLNATPKQNCHCSRERENNSIIKNKINNQLVATVLCWTRTSLTESKTSSYVWPQAICLAICSCVVVVAPPDSSRLHGCK